MGDCWFIFLYHICLVNVINWCLMACISILLIKNDVSGMFQFSGVNRIEWGSESENSALLHWKCKTLVSDGSLFVDVSDNYFITPKLMWFFFSSSLIVPLLQQPLFSNWISTTQLMHVHVRRNIWRGKLEAWAIWSSVSLIIHVSLLLLLLLFCVLTSLVHTPQAQTHTLKAI